MAAEAPTPAPNPEILPYEWSYPVPMDEETRQISGYSGLYVSDATVELDRMFGMDMSRPGELSDEARYQLDFAMLFSPMSYESTKVINYLLRFAKLMNYFHALPFDEITSATRGNITQQDLEEAIEEGYIRISDHPQWNVRLAALTPKFGSYTLPQDRRQPIQGIE